MHIHAARTLEDAEVKLAVSSETICSHTFANAVHERCGGSISRRRFDLNYVFRPGQRKPCDCTEHET